MAALVFAVRESKGYSDFVVAYAFLIVCFVCSRKFSRLSRCTPKYLIVFFVSTGVSLIFIDVKVFMFENLRVIIMFSVLVAFSCIFHLL